MKFTALNLLDKLNKIFGDKFIEGCEPCIMVPRNPTEAYLVKLPLAKPYVSATIGIEKSDLDRPVADVIADIVAVVNASANITALDSKATENLEAALADDAEAPQSLRDLLAFDLKDSDVTVEILTPWGDTELYPLQTMKMFCQHVQQNDPGLMDTPIKITWHEAKTPPASTVFEADRVAKAWAESWMKYLNK